ETKAPNGYVLNTEKVEFTISESAEGKPESTDAGTAVNYKGSVRLTKEDAEGKKLEGAVFKIVDSDGKTVKEDLVSDKDGKVETSGLAPGHYAFIETKAPDGYVLNTEKKEFAISETAEGKPESTDAGTAVNYKGSVQLIKKDQDGNVLDGAVFKIIDSDGKTVRDDLMTKEGGKIDAGGLAPGNYQFVETKAPDGYLLSTTPVPFTIKAENSGKPNQAALTAVNIKNSVVLTKLDQGDKRKVLQGAKFNLTDANGKVLTEGLTTDEHGQIIVRGLKAGEYRFIETKAPELYSLDQTPISFKITNTDIKPVEISAENTLTPGDVTLTKVDHDDKNKVLEGAEFKITDSAGHPVNTGGSKERPAIWKTDQKGRFTVKGLAPGQYRFIETKAPDGYQLNEKPIEFTIEKGQLKAVEVVVSNKKLKNPVPGKDTPNHQTNQGGHHPDTNGKTNHPDTGKNLPKTGDTDGMMPVTAGILLLLAGGAAAVVSRKKARNR
ncbi:SpaA isopeptide-forming pilin-related protein, partial [Bacillus velezensis]